MTYQVRNAATGTIVALFVSAPGKPPASTTAALSAITRANLTGTPHIVTNPHTGWSLTAKPERPTA
jgi:hypothetical protein